MIIHNDAHILAAKVVAQEEPCATENNPTPRERLATDRIRPSTWSLIDKKAALARQGILKQREWRQLVRKIKAHLEDDRRQWAPI